jgi:glycosyltransferase involved in cell wall biosynthesis
MKIAFFYTIFPVTGGGNVHGYHLAKALHEEGCELYTINSDVPFVHYYKRSLLNLFRIIYMSDVVYMRVPSLIRPTNKLILRWAKLLNRKVVGELNGPLDELQFQGYDHEQIKAAEQKLSRFLQALDHVITVSPVMQQYIKDKLACQKTTVIPNGGELLPGSDQAGEETRNFFNKLRKEFKSISIWSGTNYPWHGFEVLTALTEGVSKDHAFIIVSDAKEVVDRFGSQSNVFIFHRMPREKLQQMIRLSDIGLVIYGDYSWSGIGFYGSSLKFHEYLCAGLSVVTNKAPEIASDQVYYSEKVNDLAGYINKYKPEQHQTTACRTWTDVAKETIDVLSQL